MKSGGLQVCVPVADLRKEPVDHRCSYERDQLQETQVLYNEKLHLIHEKDEWCFVEASEQIRTDASGYTHGYPGWIRRSAVAESNTQPVFNAVINKVSAILSSEPSHHGATLGKLPLGVRLTVEEEGGTGDWLRTRLSDNPTCWIRTVCVNTASTTRSTEQLRESLITTAELFIGMPYLWGGRSVCTPQHAWRKVQGSRLKVQGLEKDHQLSECNNRTKVSEKDGRNLLPLTFKLNPDSTTGAVCGVDCSGFTNLVYRANLVDIPRDAADQARVCTPIAIDKLKRADLIFVSAPDAADEIVHVMLSLGGEEFIEAAETGSLVRRCTFKEKYGFTARELDDRQWNVNGRQICFGSILDDRVVK